ncbi:hypothetical protein WCX72_00870 [Sulfurimonas sp. HSL1-6]|uniref:hypothetical protein n=1 Tax=Thiomicrolovo immobilis TaxID=3131935 RepID=UPI0031F818FF
MKSADTSPEENDVASSAPDIIEQYLGFKARHFLLALAGVVIGAFYLSNLLFGNASLEVLLQLENYEGHLTSEIARLKQENATLQKEYFELKELEPSE